MISRTGKERDNERANRFRRQAWRKEYSASREQSQCLALCQRQRHDATDTMMQHVNANSQRRLEVIQPHAYLHCGGDRQQRRQCDIHEVLRRLLSNNSQDKRQGKCLHCLIAQFLEQRRQYLQASRQHHFNVPMHTLHGKQYQLDPKHSMW